MSRRLDLTGRRFGMLTAVRLGEKRTSGRLHWVCRCDCGALKEVNSNNLVRGKSSNCGCLARKAASSRRRTHGLSYTPMYCLWYQVKRRTLYPKHPAYPNYGGRGIGMYGPWVRDPENFINWILTNLGERPSGMSLDRIDNNGNYEPGNLRWATNSQQVRNRRPYSEWTKKGTR